MAYKLFNIRYYSEELMSCANMFQLPLICTGNTDDTNSNRCTTIAVTEDGKHSQTVNRLTPTAASYKASCARPG